MPRGLVETSGNLESGNEYEMRLQLPRASWVRKTETCKTQRFAYEVETHGRTSFTSWLCGSNS
jgi:hypothetical protein